MTTRNVVERARRERIPIKLLTTMLTAYGYALLAGAAWEPLTHDLALTSGNIILALTALVFHGLALYVAPEGEAK
jgi:hypothetical protein